jgi:lipopolysaccharide transport system permease protein
MPMDQSLIETPESRQWTVLTPRKPLFDLRLAEVWAYRDLVWLFVRRDFVATYKQTLLGPLWFLLQPLFTTIVFTVIFGKIADLPTDGLPDFLFFMAGVVVWNYFADCITKTSQTFNANSGVFGKVYFPRMTVPVASVISNLITFAIQFALFLLIVGWFLLRGSDVHPSWRVIVLPALVLQMALLGIGVGCLVSALTTRYKDLNMAVGFGVQLWMYGSAVIIPRSEVPANLQWLMTLNPMVPVVESFRFAFLGSGTVEFWQLAAGAVLSLGIFVWGVVVFNRVERTFTDTI